MISREELSKLAALARLRLDEAEIVRFQADMSEMLEYVRKLESVDTAGIELSSQVSTGGNVVRDDIVNPSLPVDEALKNAPARVGDFFKVPPVVER